MAKLNIPSSVEDPSYRYQMHRIISKKEGRGNGSKTGIMNIGEVARDINRDPMYLTKFFGYELCTQTSYTKGERAVINGHHDTPILQKLVDDFIEKYVLCRHCHYPEIDMVVNKKGLVVATCKACGWKGQLDNRHKLATFISKNPPSSGIGFEKHREDGDDDANSYQSEDQQEPKGKKPKKDKKPDREDERDDKAGEKNEKKEKKSKKEKTRDKDEDEDEDEDGEVKQKKSEKEKKDKKEKQDETDKQEKKEKKDKIEKNEKKDKKKEKQADSGSEQKKSDEEEKEEELRYDDEVMSGVVKDLAEFVKNEKITVDKMYEEVRAQQVTKSFDNKLRMFAVISAFFPSGTLSAKGVENHSEFIKEFITKGRLPFAEWIWGFQAYLAANPSATKAWAMSLKALYDADLAEEEQILEYYKGQNDSPGFDASKKAVAPFIKWLETSEDSSDDGD